MFKCVKYSQITTQDSSILEILFSRQFFVLKDTKEFFFILARVQIYDVWNGETYHLNFNPFHQMLYNSKFACTSGLI